MTRSSKGYLTHIQKLKNWGSMILITSEIALSWLLNGQILQNIYQRVDLNPMCVFVGIFLMVLIGGITTISQTFKAAIQNPVDNLRHE